MQWARFFVKTGLIYVSYLTHTRITNYTQTLTKTQKFPLLKIWKEQTRLFFNNKINETTNRRKKSFSRFFTNNMPLPVTVATYRVMLKCMVHWNDQNIKTWFYPNHFQRLQLSYFLMNPAKTVAYFWRNINTYDVEKLRRTRIKKHTINWLT